MHLENKGLNRYCDIFLSMSETRVRDRREYMRQYRESHREHLKELNKAYWERNKESINERMNTKHQCEICGGRYTTKHRNTHEHSKKHQKALETQT